MPVLMLRNMNIFVDDWAKPVHKDTKCHRFMTRLSFNIKDRLEYITRNTNDIIYTSQFNKWYLIKHLKIDEKKIVDIPYNGSIVIKDELNKNEIKVTSLDANYCVGSTMFLFQGAFGNNLYTGFFRLNKSVLEFPLLKDLSTFKKLNTVYFDNTYAAEHCEFPERDVVIKSLITEVKSKPSHQIIIEAGNLGKEEVFCELAYKTNENICVSKDRYHILQALGIEKHFTTDKKAARISVWDKKVTQKNYITLQATKGPHLLFHLTACYVGETDNYASNLAKANNIPEAKILPYSNHCSHSELMEFLTLLSPRRIEPIVKFGSGSLDYRNSIVPTCMIQCCYMEETNYHSYSLGKSEIREKLTTSKSRSSSSTDIHENNKSPSPDINEKPRSSSPDLSENHSSSNADMNEDHRSPSPDRNEYHGSRSPDINEKPRSSSPDMNGNSRSPCPNMSENHTSSNADMNEDHRSPSPDRNEYHGSPSPDIYEKPRSPEIIVPDILDDEVTINCIDDVNRVETEYETFNIPCGNINDDVDNNQLVQVACTPNAVYIVENECECNSEGCENHSCIGKYITPNQEIEEFDALSQVGFSTPYIIIDSDQNNEHFILRDRISNDVISNKGRKRNIPKIVSQKNKTSQSQITVTSKDNRPLMRTNETNSQDHGPLMGTNKTNSQDHGPRVGTNETDLQGHGPLLGTNETNLQDCRPSSLGTNETDFQDLGPLTRSNKMNLRDRRPLMGSNKPNSQDRGPLVGTNETNLQDCKPSSLGTNEADLQNHGPLKRSNKMNLRDRRSLMDTNKTNSQNQGPLMGTNKINSQTETNSQDHGPLIGTNKMNLRNRKPLSGTNEAISGTNILRKKCRKTLKKSNQGILGPIVTEDKEVFVKKIEDLNSTSRCIAESANSASCKQNYTSGLEECHVILNRIEEDKRSKNCDRNETDEDGVDENATDEIRSENEVLGCFSGNNDDQSMNVESEEDLVQIIRTKYRETVKDKEKDITEADKENLNSVSQNRSEIMNLTCVENEESEEIIYFTANEFLTCETNGENDEQALQDDDLELEPESEPGENTHTKITEDSNELEEYFAENSEKSTKTVEFERDKSKEKVVEQEDEDKLNQDTENNDQPIMDKAALERSQVSEIIEKRGECNLNEVTEVDCTEESDELVYFTENVDQLTNTKASQKDRSDVDQLTKAKASQKDTSEMTETDDWNQASAVIETKGAKELNSSEEFVPENNEKSVSEVVRSNETEKDTVEVGKKSATTIDDTIMYFSVKEGSDELVYFTEKVDQSTNTAISEKQADAEGNSNSVATINNEEMEVIEDSDELVYFTENVDQSTNTSISDKSKSKRAAKGAVDRKLNSVAIIDNEDMVVTVPQDSDELVYFTENVDQSTNTAISEKQADAEGNSNSVATINNKEMEVIEDSDELVYFTENVDQSTNTSISDKSKSKRAVKGAVDRKLNSVAIIDNEDMEVTVPQDSDELVYFTENVDQSTNASISDKSKSKRAVKGAVDRKLNSVAIIDNQDMVVTVPQDSDELVYFTENVDQSTNTAISEKQADAEGNSNSVATINNKEMEVIEDSDELVYFTENVDQSTNTSISDKSKSKRAVKGAVDRKLNSVAIIDNEDMEVTVPQDSDELVYFTENVDQSTNASISDKSKSKRAVKGAVDRKLNPVAIIDNEDMEVTVPQDSDELVYFTENIDQSTNTSVSDKSKSKRAVKDAVDRKLNSVDKMNNEDMELIDDSDELVYFTENVDISINTPTSKKNKSKRDVKEAVEENLNSVDKMNNEDMELIDDSDELVYFTERTNTTMEVSPSKKSKTKDMSTITEENPTMDTTKIPSSELETQNEEGSTTDMDSDDDDHDGEVEMMSKVVSKITKKSNQIDKRLQRRILINQKNGVNSESLVALWKAFLSIWECSLVKVEQKVEPIITDRICTCQDIGKNTKNYGDGDSDDEILYFTDDEYSTEICIPIRKTIGPDETVEMEQGDMQCEKEEADESDDELCYFDRDFSPIELKAFACQFSTLHKKLKRLKITLRKICKMNHRKRKLSNDSRSIGENAKRARPLTAEDSSKCNALCRRANLGNNVVGQTSQKLPENMENGLNCEFEESDNSESLIKTSKGDHRRRSRRLSNNSRINFPEELKGDVERMYNECLVIIKGFIMFLLSEG